MGFDVAGVILAGGLARRMGGGDKALIELDGTPLLRLVCERLSPQVNRLVLNANGDPTRFAGYNLPVVKDPIEGAAGPLAGVLAGLEWVHANAPDAKWMVSVAGDTPFFPRDLVDCLAAACLEGNGDMACASSNGRAHPVFGLWPVKLAGALRDAVIEEGVRKVDQWTGRYRCIEVEFSSQPHDPFFNLNRPEDLIQARAFLSKAAS